MKTNYTTKMITLALTLCFELATQASAHSNIDFSRINSIRSQTDAITAPSASAPSMPLQPSAFYHVDSLSRFKDRSPPVSDIKNSNNYIILKESFNKKFMIINYDSK